MASTPKVQLTIQRILNINTLISLKKSQTGQEKVEKYLVAFGPKEIRYKLPTHFLRSV